ncbi:MAG: inositol monophosphatase [Bacteroidales bacterium]|nr:inositol monophosphatase [Bacteroidales bacterium]
MNPEETRKILHEALIKGGDLLLDHLGGTTRATIKESISSVVTEADLASERAILEVLGDTPRPFNVITEETGYMNNHSEYTWVVDPLDGTSNFAARLPWFGVIIALFREETPILGGMYLPVDQYLYLTEAGKGATLNGKPIRATASKELAANLVAYSFDFSDTPGKTESEMKILKSLSKKVRNIRSTNSLIDFCYTADGRLGAALNQTTKIWDIAVPWLMIREAGGMVTDIGGNEIRFDLSEEAVNLNYTILASGAGLHEPLLEIIKVD